MNTQFIKKLVEFVSVEASDCAERYAEEVTKHAFLGSYYLERFQYFRYMEELLSHLSKGAEAFMPKIEENCEATEPSREG